MAVVGDLLMLVLSVGCWAIIVVQLRDETNALSRRTDGQRWSSRLGSMVMGLGLVALMFFIAFFGFAEPSAEWRRNGVAAVHGWAIGTLSIS
ncbi:MAG: hypothetical protein AAF449_11315, partial [Myxococcota bacterium]